MQAAQLQMEFLMLIHLQASEKLCFISTQSLRMHIRASCLLAYNGEYERLLQNAASFQKLYKENQ